MLLSPLSITTTLRQSWVSVSPCMQKTADSKVGSLCLEGNTFIPFLGELAGGWDLTKLGRKWRKIIKKKKKNHIRFIVH